MTRGRPPRRPRRISYDPIALARNNATRLTAAEISSAITPLRAATRALREGVATQAQWLVAASAMTMAQSIEQQGVVRGLYEHLHAAELALQAIEQRATASGTWCATALYWHELDSIDTAIDLHEYQMQQLSYGEFRRAMQRAVNEVRSTGGRAVDIDLVQEALL